MLYAQLTILVEGREITLDAKPVKQKDIPNLFKAVNYLRSAYDASITLQYQADDSVFEPREDIPEQSNEPAEREEVLGDTCDQEINDAIAPSDNIVEIITDDDQQHINKGADDLVPADVMDTLDANPEDFPDSTFSDSDTEDNNIECSDSQNKEDEE